MNKYINLFVMMIIAVHLNNGQIIKFEKGYSYYQSNAWGNCTSWTVRSWNKDMSKLKNTRFSCEAVSYITEGDTE